VNTLQSLMTLNVIDISIYHQVRTSPSNLSLMAGFHLTQTLTRTT
jgi:hypothetical protein